MSVENNDFLRFNAYSIKELITRKLAQDSNFTDQIYEGSNLAILIDIVSYMFQCLVYQLNNAAAEAMFSDTQLYENMVRLVKFLDYNPRGCSPSQMNIIITCEAEDNSTILPFSYIDTGLTDSNGRQICFSNGIESINIEQSQGSLFSATLYNGMWKLYDTVFTASGIEYEQFTLENMKSYSEDKCYVANDFILVYVYDQTTKQYTKWNMDKNGIFISSRRYSDQGEQKYFSLYGNNKDNGGSEDNVYTISLNENHAYVIKFGDGHIGNTLKKGNLVYIVYLDTNGYDGQIDTNKFNIGEAKFKRNNSISNMSQRFKMTVYNTAENPNDVEDAMENLEYDMQYDTKSSYIVTNFTPEQSVEDIRSYAPNWFKTGYRLITRGDYEYFIKNNKDIENQLRIGSIIDVKCMNNTEIVSKFYKWLYIQGLNREESDGRYYFDGDFFQRTQYYYVDPSDSNNIYLWIKTNQELTNDMVKTSSKLLNGSLLNYLKIMTAEIQVMKPVTVNFDICAAPVDYIKEEYFTDNIDSEFDINCESYIEITIDDNQTYVGNNMLQSIANIIKGTFDQNIVTLGQTINSVDITNQIYQINGVSRIRTVWKQPNSEFIKAVDGISFASWSDSSILDQYEDLTVTNSLRHIEDFQYPNFVGENRLIDRIKIIKKQLTTVNPIKF